MTAERCPAARLPHAFHTALVKQLLLNLHPALPASFDNYIGGGNEQAREALMAALTSTQAEHMLYLWGEPGSGRSHLLQAAIREAQAAGKRAAYVDCAQLFEPDDALGEYDCVALDNVEHLGPVAQVVVFSIYNRLREARGVLVAAGPCPPSQLPLRADLTTRFGWGLVYQLQPLSDADKIQALQQHASERGFSLSQEVCDYLLLRWRRDLPSLLAVIDELDRASLEQQRQVTLPLLREVLQRQAHQGQQALF